MAKKILGILALTLVLIASPAWAEIDCSAEECPSGDKKVAFLDGAHTTCICMEPGSDMTATDEDAPVGEPQPGDA